MVILTSIISLALLSIIYYTYLKLQKKPIKNPKSVTLPSDLTLAQANVLKSLTTSEYVADITIKDDMSLYKEILKEKQLPLLFYTTDVAELYLSYDINTYMNKYSVFKGLIKEKLTSSNTTKVLPTKEKTSMFIYGQAVTYVNIPKEVSIPLTDIVFTTESPQTMTGSELMEIGHQIGKYYAEYENNIILALLTGNTISTEYTSIASIVDLSKRLLKNTNDYTTIIVAKSLYNDYLVLQQELPASARNRLKVIEIPDETLVSLKCNCVIVQGYKPFEVIKHSKKRAYSTGVVHSNGNYIQTVITSQYSISGEYICDLYNISITQEEESPGQVILPTIH